MSPTRLDAQQTLVLDYLKAGNSITPIEALNLFGSFRLAAIIHRLRSEWEIKTIMEGGANLAGGVDARYARYVLIGPKPEPAEPEDHD